MGKVFTVIATQIKLAPRIDLVSRLSPYQWGGSRSIMRWNGFQIQSDLNLEVHEKNATMLVQITLIPGINPRASKKSTVNCKLLWDEFSFETGLVPWIGYISIANYGKISILRDCSMEFLSTKCHDNLKLIWKSPVPFSMCKMGYSKMFISWQY